MSENHVVQSGDSGASPAGESVPDAPPVNLEVPSLGLHVEDPAADVNASPIWTQQQLDSIIQLTESSATRVAVQAAMQALSFSTPAGAAPAASVAARERSVPSFSLSEVSKQIPLYSGDDQSKMSIEMWIDRVDALRERFHVSEDEMLLLASNRLVSRAADWYFACPELVRATWNEFAEKIKMTFHSEVDQMDLFDRMRSRVWNKEPIGDYYYDKLNMMKRLRLSSTDMVLYLIRGIPIPSLRTQLKVLNCETPEQLFVYMKSCAEEYVPVKSDTSDNRTKERLPQIRKPNVSTVTKECTNPPKFRSEPVAPSKTVRCFNCYRDGHYASACPKPKRPLGSCFACGSTQHQFKDCTERRSPPPSREDKTTFLIEVEPPHQVEVKIAASPVDGSTHNEPIDLCAIVDTGSPVSLIRYDIAKHFEIESCTVYDPVCTGINDSPLLFKGRVRLAVTSKSCVTFDLLFYVVSETTMTSPLLFGRNFTRHSDLDVVISRNNITIDKKPTVELVNELLLIDVPDNAPFVELDVCKTVSPSIVQDLNHCYEATFISSSSLVERQADFTAEIRLNDNHEIFNFPPRRLSHADKRVVHEIIIDLLDRGIIRRSCSPYASPIVLCGRKDGSHRLCVDYRALNKLAKRDRYPLPLIDDQLDQLSGATCFSKLDLKDAFFNVKLTETSTQYTAFVTPTGQYEFLRLPFGYCNGPALFARFIANVFRDLLEQGKVVIYLDDILIATRSIEENVSILKEVFSLLAEHNLQPKLQKCSFLYPFVEYLGYIIDESGIRPNPEHVKSISVFPTPTSVKQTQSFLGLCSYFRKFIPQFSAIAKPLYDLTKKGAPFLFGQSELESMEQLKCALRNQPVLAIYSPTAETELHCDASSYGFGSVLLQKQPDTNRFHPVCFFSKRTTDSESRYHSYELECLAIVYALKKFDVYLRGIPFKIVTDCNSLKQTLSKKDVVPRIMRWVLLLQDFNYTIEHRVGERMKHVDALSRMYQICLLEENSFDLNLAIKQQADVSIKSIREELEARDHPFYELRNGVVYRKQNESILFYVPEVMESAILNMYHDQMGHGGADKTVELITRTYWFPSLRAKVKCHIENCLKCIVYNPHSGRAEGFLHPIPKGNLPLDTIHADHLKLEKTPRGMKYLLLIVDACTKFAKLYPCRTTNAKEVIRHLDSFISAYSLPRRIITDRGSAFTSRDFEEFLFENGVQTIHAATGSPQANGQVERFNRTIIPMLAKIAPSPDQWDKVTKDVEFALNNTINKSTGHSPSRLLFGINQRTNNRDRLRDMLEIELDTSFDLNGLQILRKDAEKHVDRAQASNKLCYDKRRKPARIYRLGDKVVVENVVTTPGVNRKLLPKFKGPYEVCKVLPNDRYVLKDVDGFQLSQRPFDSVFEAARMRPWSAD